MKIGFDVSQTGSTKAGCGYFAHGLIDRLAAIDRRNNYVLYPAVGDQFWDSDCAESTYSTDRPNFQRLKAPETFELSRSFWRNPPDDVEELLGNPDIFHANNFFCPRLKTARLLYTLYDLGFLEDPGWTTEANRTGCFSGVFNASLRADWIVAISQYSRRHYLQTFPHYSPDRISVVYPGSRFENRAGLARPARLSQLEPDGFWLSVATLEPRKNHARLIEAYSRFKAETGSTMPLVLAGGSGWLMQGLEDALTGVKPTEVIRTGYVADSELQWLYENCYALIYPSLFEGFGLPVLEAMSLGAAVIASNTTSLPEIVGSAGATVNPLEVGEILAAMKRMADDQAYRDALRSAAPARARQFSWGSAARQVLEIYERLGRPQERSHNTASPEQPTT